MRIFKASALLMLFLTIASAQQRKGAPAPAAGGQAAKICADPYAVGVAADGWPEAPVNILFHRDKSKAPWTRNPAIRLTGLEAAAPSSAKTIVCVEESRQEVGSYDSGEPAYSPAWDVTLVRASDRKVYFMRVGFYGKEPPGIKFHRGAGVGKPPVEMFTSWLRLVVAQKVARLKMRLKPKEYHEASGLAFSADGTRLVLTQEPRSTSNGTPPAPITVFDLATGQAVMTAHTDLGTRQVAISRTGRWVATERFGHPQIWDVATGQLAQKFDKFDVASLAFAGDDTLAVAGGDKAVLFSVPAGRELRSLRGAYMAQLPEGGWMVAVKGAKGFTVQELESGKTIAEFPSAGQDKPSFSGDGRAFARSSLMSATMYVSGSAEPHSLALPNVGLGFLSAIAPTRDGFVVANNDGIAGIVSATSPEPRAFATDYTSIKAVAVSADGKLLALGDSSGDVSVWELR